MITSLLKKPLTPKSLCIEPKICVSHKAMSFADFSAIYGEHHEETKVSQSIDEFAIIEYMKPHIDSMHQLDFQSIQNELEYRTVCLLDPPTRALLILDLDETLIFNGLRDEVNPIDNITIRPFTEEFLEKVLPYFEIWIWTASDSTYAEYVLAVLDPHNKYITRVITKESCTKSGDFWVKDIRIFQNLNLKKVIILDNLLISFAPTLHNGILIAPYTNNPKDCELKMLGEFLIEIYDSEDYRKVLKATFDYGKYVY
jgi:RNA polymerase II subunit A small phosphatase-like protein